MAITFIKNSRFIPQDVIDATFEADENWTIKGLTFVKYNHDQHNDITEYTLTILHKKTGKETDKMHLTIKQYGSRQYGGDLMEVEMRPEADKYGYAVDRHRDRQRNIFILLRKLVKSVDFIKGMYQMRRATRREVFKTFGKIFKRRE